MCLQNGVHLLTIHFFLCFGDSRGIKNSKNRIYLELFHYAVFLFQIEIDPIAANAYRLNFPKCKVIAEDCNTLLKMLLNDNCLDEIGLPKKGDVEMLIVGPPCQGFSGMNRFSSGEYSALQNSLIVTFLSYCEYYR